MHKLANNHDPGILGHGMNEAGNYNHGHFRIPVLGGGAPTFAAG
jgi:hypothetical protein